MLLGESDSGAIAQDAIEELGKHPNGALKDIEYKHDAGDLRKRAADCNQGAIS